MGVKLGLSHRGGMMIFENVVLGKMVGSMWGQTPRHWGLLSDEELQDFYSSLNVIWVIKSRRIIYVAGMREIVQVHTECC
jgi:hypothetical protein